MKDIGWRAFAPLHASDRTLEEVFRMIETKKRKTRTLRRAVVIGAAAAAALTVTAFAADYVVNGREVFFFDTLAALTQKYSEDHPGSAVIVGMPGTAEESAEAETSAEYVARTMRDGMFEDETVLEQSESGGVRRRVAECHSDFYGDIVNEYIASPGTAECIAVDGVVDWDLSALTDTLTPEEGGQLLTLTRNTDGDLIRVKAHAGYVSADGAHLTLNWAYDPRWDGGQTEYVLNDAYDGAELFTADDGTQVLLLAYDGQVWASAANGDRTFELYAVGLSTDEMKALLNALAPASALNE